MARGLIIAPGLDDFITMFSIKEIKPEFIAFLTTEATISSIKPISEKTGIKNCKVFFIKNIFSTAETIQEFFNSLNWLKEQNVGEIYVDATNCISVIEMATYLSASLVDLFKEVLGEDIKFKLVYVHSDYKIREDGVAGEIRGTEKLVELEKPLDSLSFVLAFDAIRSFNNQRYTQAGENFSVLSKNTIGEKSVLYQGLASLAAGYDLWNKMDIDKAIKHLEEAKEILEKVKGFELVSKIIFKIKENLDILDKLKDNDESSIILDLYSNASRKVYECCFDDALARLYACLERITQYQLKKHGVETKNPDFSKLPPEVFEKFKQNFDCLPKELELKKNALLLMLLNDPIGQEVKKIGYKTFLGLIGIRNNSILAHGTKPVSKEHFWSFKNKLLEPIMQKFIEVNNIKEEELEKHQYVKIKGIEELLYKKTINPKTK